MATLRQYSEAERAGFSLYIGERAKVRPLGCHAGADCWVNEGPPAYTAVQPGTRNKGIYCAGCGDKPNLPRDKRGTYTLR